MPQDGYVEAYGLNHDRDGIKNFYYSSPFFYLKIMLTSDKELANTIISGLGSIRAP